MPVLIRPKRWNAKPPLGAAIETGHPLAAGLVDCVIFNEAGGHPRDLVSGEVSTSYGSGQSWAPYGRSVNGSGGDQLIDKAARQLVGAMTVAVGFVSTLPLSDLAAFRGVAAKRDTGAEWGINFLNGAPVSQFYWTQLGSPGSFQVVSSAVVAPPNVVQHWAGVRRNATSGELWQNGVMGGSNSGLQAAGATTNLVHLGTTDSASAEPLIGQLLYYYLWNRPLSGAELQWLNAEPYALIQPPKARRFVSAPAVMPPHPNPLLQNAVYRM